MTFFPTHAVVGAAIRAGTTRGFCHLIGVDPHTAVWIAAAWGAVEGMAPDALDYLAAKFFRAHRWELYSRMHTGDLVWLGWIFWGYGAHIWTDRPFHKIPGLSWWPTLWSGEIASLLIASGVLTWALFWP